MAAMTATRLPRWLARDAPDFLNLRKAGRAAIVAPAVLAFAMVVLGNDAIAMYSVFAAFVGLVFADYGGPPLRRAGAYLTMTVLGAALIVLGGLVSGSVALSVVLTLVVVVAVNLAAGFGGYWALHVSPAILAFALSVLQPTSQLAIVDRVLGWTIGSLAALVAALLLWPVATRLRLRERTAFLLEELGQLVGDLPTDAAADRLTQVRSAMDDVQRRLAAPFRPFGPASRDLALVHLIENVEHCVDLVSSLVDAGGVVDTALLGQVGASLRRASAILASAEDPATAAADLIALDATRTRALEHVGDRLTEASDPAAAADEAVASLFPALALSHLTIWVEHEAIRVAGGTPELPALATAPEMHPFAADGMARRVERTRRMLLRELDPGGFILRNSLRAGVALAAAVAAADLLPVAHGFWIVLGALSVLRSGASSTYATALQAVGGTVAGFAIAVPIAWAAQDSPAALWIAFVVGAVLAAYTPGAIHFAVGQAAFTVFVVALFALLDTPGVGTAVIRVETVTVGALTAVALSLVLWPRGARRALSRAVADEYSATARSAETFVDGSSEDRLAAREELDAARRAAEATFAAAVNEHKEPIDVSAWVRILQPPTVARALAAGLIPHLRAPAACAALAADARDAARALAVDLDAVAAWLRGTDERLPPAWTPRGRRGAGPCVASAAGDSDAARGVIFLLAWSMYIDRLGDQLSQARPALQQVVRARAK